MSSKLFFAAVLAVAIPGFALSAQEVKKEVVKETVTKTEIETPYNPIYVMGRGVANVGTCAVEIPRCMVYNNSLIPIVGFVVGAVEGSFLTTFRAVGGVFDIASLGFTGSGVYSDKLPEFIWDSKWLPKRETVIIEKTVEKTSEK